MEIIRRIRSLTGQHKASWGRMTVAGMVTHCALCEEYYNGTIKIRRSFLGLIIGKAALRSILQDDKNGLRKNAPTAALFRVDDAKADFETGKAKWLALTENYGSYRKEGFVHWFFGYMTKQQLGQFIYKHSDHHLRQFGV